MKLKSLWIRDIPGLNDELKLMDLPSKGMVVIEGDNGSGKTTVCRAIRAILWEKPKGVRVDASWQLEDGTTGICELRGGNTGWDGSPPLLPPSHLSGAYTLRVDEMLREDASDSELAGKMAAEMAGGYNLPALRDQFKLEHSTKTKNEYKSASEAFHMAVQYDEDLIIREDSLPELEVKLNKANEAEMQLNRLKIALTYRNELRIIDELECQMNDFPVGMNLLNAADRDMRDNLQARIQSEMNDFDSKNRKYQDLSRSFANSICPAGEPISTEILNEWDKSIGDISAMESSLEQLKKERDDAERKLQHARLSLLPDSPQSLPDHVTLRDVERAEDLLRRQAFLHEKKDACDKLLNSLQEPGERPQEFETTNVKEGIRALTSWLQVAESPFDAMGKSTRSSSMLGMALQGLLVLIILVFAFIYRSPLLLLPALVAAGVFYIIVKLNRNIADPALLTANRQMYERDYLKYGLKPPTHWDRDSVEAELLFLMDRWKDDLRQCLEARTLYDERSGLRKIILGDLQQTEKLINDMQVETDDFAQKIGSHAGEIRITTVDMLRLVNGYRTASETLTEVNERLTTLRIQISEALDALSITINQFYPESNIQMENSESARDLLRKIRNECDAMIKAQQKYREEQAALETAKHASEETAERLNKVQQDWLQFLQAKNIKDDQSLMERLILLEDWQRLKEDMQAHHTTLRNARLELEDHNDLLELTLPEIERELQLATALKGSRDVIIAQITGIRNDIKMIRENHSCEACASRRDRAYVALVSSRDQNLECAAAQFLLDKIGQESKRNLPSTAKLSSEKFSGFTNGKYTLELEDIAAGEPLIARQSVDKRKVPLNRLSAGTRMQLLLAVRLAFIEEEEKLTGCEPLHIFMDETLEHCDPARYLAIVEGLQFETSHGRQIFYLTCDPAQTRRLQSYFAPDSFHVCNIDEIRTGRNAWKSLAEIPAYDKTKSLYQDGLSYDELGIALQVGPVDLLNGWEGIHLWHLLRTKSIIRLLVPLVSAGINTAGQWHALPNGVRVHFNLADEEIDYIDKLVELAKGVALDWSVGHGRRMTEEIIRKGAGGSAFTDKLLEMAEELDWDGSRFLHRLKDKEADQAVLKGIRKNTLTALEDTLREEGCISEDNLIQGEVIFHNALERCDPEWLTVEEIQQVIEGLGCQVAG